MTKTHPPAMFTVPQRPLLVVLASVAAAVGALTVAVMLARKIRAALTPDVLLFKQGVSYTVRLEQSFWVTHNVRLFRFSLQGPQQRLGFQVGEHVLLYARIGGRLVMRPYTPVSHCDKRGSFDIMVKIYAAGTSPQFPNGGRMSQFLNTLRPGAKIQIQGPKGRFVYEGRGRFALTDGGRMPLVTRLGLVAAGSGVTPMLQLLRNMLSDDIDQTHVLMVDVNTSDKDIIARLELDEYAKGFGHQFSICHVLSEPPSSEGEVKNYVPGPLSLEILTRYLPAPDFGALVLCCGPPTLINDVVKPALQQIGHKPHQVLCY